MALSILTVSWENPNWAVPGLEFNAIAGLKRGQFDRKRDLGLAGSHTVAKKRISNVEVRNSIDFY